MATNEEIVNAQREHRMGGLVLIVASVAMASIGFFLPWQSRENGLDFLINNSWWTSQFSTTLIPYLVLIFCAGLGCILLGFSGVYRQPLPPHPSICCVVGGILMFSSQLSLSAIHTWGTPGIGFWVSLGGGFLAIAGAWVTSETGWNSMRDRSVDGFLNGLLEKGINAEIVRESMPEEEIQGKHYKYDSCLGLIRIKDSPINFVKISRESLENTEGEERTTANFLTHDDSISDLPEFAISTTKVHSQPILGSVIDVNWEGNNKYLTTFETLIDDIQLRNTIMLMKHDLCIISRPEYGFWVISVDIDSREVHPHKFPSKEEWECFEAISGYLVNRS